MDPLIKEVVQAWAAKGDDGSPDWEDYVEDVTIAVNLVRERIATDIESAQYVHPSAREDAYNQGLRSAARIARGVN